MIIIIPLISPNDAISNALVRTAYHYPLPLTIQIDTTMNAVATLLRLVAYYSNNVGVWVMCYPFIRSHVVTGFFAIPKISLVLNRQRFLWNNKGFFAAIRPMGRA